MVFDIKYVMMVVVVMGVIVLSSCIFRPTKNTQSIQEIDLPFKMMIEGVFSMPGTGTVATGHIESGIIRLGEEVHIDGLDKDLVAIVNVISVLNKNLKQADANDKVVGLLFRSIEKDQIQRGMVISKVKF